MLRKLQDVAPFRGSSFNSIINEEGECFEHFLHEILMWIAKFDLYSRLSVESEFLRMFYAVPTSQKTKVRWRGYIARRSSCGADQTPLFPYSR